MASERNDYLDSLKGYAILLVIAHHALQRAEVFGLVAPNTALSQYVPFSPYVTMPLFIAISGYLAFGRMHEPVGPWLLGKARMLLVPLVAWTVVYFLVVRHDPLIPTDMSFGAYLNTQTPMPSLWFLLVLFYCYALLALRSKTNDWVAAVIGLVVAVLFDRWLHPLDLYWPWFLGGYFFARYQGLLGRVEKLAWPVALAVYAFALLGPITAVEGWPRIVFPLASIGVSTIVVRALCALPVGGWLAVLGKRSMTLYVGQFLFIQLIVAHSWKNIPIVIVLAVGGSLLIDRLLALNPWTDAVFLGARGVRIRRLQLEGAAA